MKLLFVDTTNHAGEIGGGHLILPVIMEGLNRAGHEVHLVTKGQPESKLQKLIDDSKCILHIKPWKNKGLVEDNAPLFAAWINKLKPDCYIISASADIGWVVLPLLDHSIAALTIGHNDTRGFYDPLAHYKPFITTAIGVSTRICDNYVSLSSVDPGRVVWIPYGVQVASPEMLDIGSDLVRIIYVGRIVEEQKRISDLISIIQKLSAGNIAYKINIVGDGPQAGLFAGVLKKEIESGHVEMRGWLENAAVIKFLRESDIVILTSGFEGFSIALTEAMANGCCPVVTDIPSGSQTLIKENVNGFLIPVGNVGLFVEKIKWLSEHRDELNKMRLNAIVTGSNYSVDKMIQRYQQCFQESKELAVKNPRSIDQDFPLMSSCKSGYPKWIRRLKLKVTGDVG